MNFTKEKYNASSAKNAPEISSPIDLNELPRSHVTQNADVLSFTNMVNQMDSNLEDGRARADCMPTVNMLDPQVLPYKIHNTSGTLPRCHNTQIADLLRFRNMVNQTDENVSARADCMPAVNMLDPVVPPYQTTNGPLHSYNHFMMVDSDNASNGTSQSNQTTQSDRSLLSVRGNTPAGVQINSQGGAGTSTHSSPDTPMSDDIYRPRMVRDLVSVGTYMHAANQYHDNWLAMAGNHVRNAAQSNYLGFPGMDLDHGIGDEMVTPFPSNNHGGAGPCNNGRTVAPRSYSSHRPQADASFLSLGHDMGDVNLPTNNSGPMLGANAGTNSTSFSSFQTVQSDAQHFYPIHRSIIGVGGSADSRNGNINPYRGYHGYSSVAPRHLSGIQAPMLANEQARPVMIGQPSIIAAQDHNQLVPAQVHNQVVPAQQHYLNNLRSALNSYSMAPPFVGTMASTSQIDQSGHIAPARDVSVPQASKFSGRKGNMKEQAQPATNDTPRVSRKGKRGPTEASQYAQPAKVHVVPSVPPGKPVLFAARSGPKPGISIPGSKLSRPSPVLVRPPKSGGLPPASATSFRSQKMIPQVSNPYPSSANQNTATYHLKCKFDEPIVSIGENCPICRRDLIFTPTGTVTQPSIPPPVAVLSCGHTFHDECLQNITPPEQSKNPPCIPCAIGKF